MDKKSYLEKLKDFKIREKEAVNSKNGEQLISWYICDEPFGLYFAAKKLWKENVQRSKDRAINYYERFVKHPDIVYEGAEVKKAIKVVLKAYRFGYGDKKENYSAAEAFEQIMIGKGFKVPKGEKRPTEPDGKKTGKRKTAFDVCVSIVGITGTILLGAIKLNEHFNKKD